MFVRLFFFCFFVFLSVCLIFFHKRSSNTESIIYRSSQLHLPFVYLFHSRYLLFLLFVFFRLFVFFFVSLFSYFSFTTQRASWMDLSASSTICVFTPRTGCLLFSFLLFSVCFLSVCLLSFCFFSPYVLLFFYERSNNTKGIMDGSISFIYHLCIYSTNKNCYNFTCIWNPCDFNDL